MDFTFDEEQAALADLAARLLSERVTQDRLRHLEAEGTADGDGVDHALWAELAETGILAAPLAEEHRGAGLGFVGAAAVVEEVGRRAAPVPYLECIATSALALERFGTAELKATTLQAVGEGALIVTPALVEEQASVLEPTTTATPAPDGSWRLSGTKVCVPAALAADLVLVPARFPDGGTGVACVRSGADGLDVRRQETSLGRPEARLRLDDVEVTAREVLGGDVPERNAVLGWLAEHATAALCVLGAGCYEEATRLTAE